MRVLLVAATMTMVSLAGPAFAQDDHVPRYGEVDKEKSPEQKAADKAAQDAYKRSLGNIPDQGPTDPWGAVRSNGGSATATPPKAAAAKNKKTKTGSAEAKQ
jgi:hypothetical protein